MSGQQVGTVVGFVAGFFLPGGPQVWATIGGIAGSYISPTKFNAPGIGDAQTQTSQTGMPIPKAFGRPPPFAPSLIDGDKVARKIKKESGGKGAPPVTVSEGFIATRAFLIGEPIKAIARLTRNGKLVYSTIEGDELDADSAAFASQLRIYYGSRDQDPDPSLEAIHGVGNTHCYPGRSYFVVVDDDETQTQGAANQYRVEVIEAGTLETTCADTDMLFYYPLDDAAQNGVAVETINGNNGTYSNTAGVAVGPALRAGTAASFRMLTKNDSMVADLFSPDHRSDVSIVGRPEWTVSCYYLQEYLLHDGSLGAISSVLAAFWSDPLSGYRDWILGLNTSNIPFGGYTSSAHVDYACDGATAAAGNCLMLTYKEDAGGTTATMTLYLNGVFVDSQSITIASQEPGSLGRYVSVGGAHYPDSYGFVGCVSDVAGWGRCFTADEAAAYYKGTDIWRPLPDGGGSYYNRKTGEIYVPCATRSNSTSPQWKDIATEICNRCDARLPSHTDFDNMTDEVPGFLLGNAGLKGSDYLRTLNTFYFTNTPEYDGKIRSIRLGGSVAGTLDPDDLLTVEDQDDDLREQPVAGWARVTLVYPDPANNYVPSTQTAPRTSPDVSANSEVKIECPIPFDGDRAAQIADIIQKIKFCELEGTFKRAFPAEYDKYVASDAVNWDGRRNLILKKFFDLGMIQFEGRYDRASAYTSVAVGTAAPPPSKQSSNVKGPTLFVGFNSVRLRDSDQSPGIYFAIRHLTDGWPGCLLQVSIDDQASWVSVGTFTAESTLGELAEPVATGPGREPIVVALSSGGTAETITAEQVAVGLNRFAMITNDIAEIASFQTADENSNETFDLTDVTSGQLGSIEVEHGEGDAFVLISPSLVLITLDISLAGKTIYFRPVTLGTAEANNEIFAVVYKPQFTGPISYDAYVDELGSAYVDETGATYYTEV